MQHFYPGSSSTALYPLPFQQDAGKIYDFEIHTLQWFKQNRLVNAGVADKLDRYEFFWLKKADGVLVADLQHFDISHKTIYAFSPGQVREINPGSSMDGYYISLSPDFFYTADAAADFSFLSSRYQAVKSPAVYHMNDEDVQELEYILVKMREECTHPSSMSTEMLKGFFRVFLLYLSRKFTATELPDTNRRDKSLVKKFTELLSDHFKTKKMVTDYASELCVTPSYLNQVVKKVSGFTASYHIQQCLVLEAKRQAIHSGGSMKEIAYNLGFDDTAHFSKFFKNNSGINFTSFKKYISQHDNRISQYPLQATQN